MNGSGGSFVVLSCSWHQVIFERKSNGPECFIYFTGADSSRMDDYAARETLTVHCLPVKPLCHGLNISGDKSKHFLKPYYSGPRTKIWTRVELHFNYYGHDVFWTLVNGSVRNSSS